MIKFNKTKKNIILLIILIISIIVLTVSFAYLAIEFDSSVENVIDSDVENIERIDFVSEKDSSLYINTNFDQDANSEMAETISSAILYAGANSGEATTTYNVYYEVSQNDFIYSYNKNTPEIILTVFDPNGTEITTLSSLEYVDITDAKGVEYSGFDITSFEGFITIAENYAIASNDVNGVKQEWTLVAHFINLESDQYLNNGKVLESKLLLQTEKKLFKDALVDMDDESDGLYYHSTSLDNSTESNDYRYSGGNDLVHNYVCFDSNEEICPSANLYRVIGIIDDKIKLVKQYYHQNPLIYDANNENSWEGADVNDPSDDSDANIYLNNTYYNSLSTEYKSMIEPVLWYQGGFEFLHTGAKSWYDVEQINPTVNEYNIGLIYPSDYFYAASPENWALDNMDGNPPHDDSYYLNPMRYDENWLFMVINTVLNETTFSRYQNERSIYMINHNGNVGAVFSDSNITTYRPVFYLKDNIYIDYGEGTEDNPFRISM